VKQFSEKVNKKIVSIGDFLHKMKSYHWPGNVRELKNVIERSVILLMILDFDARCSTFEIQHQQDNSNKTIRFRCKALKTHQKKY
jgi:transcriptional regulator with AAA-type ATPase domain